ncbi:ABC transporter substrate-binding protein [Phytoactinopolyspora halotolerans]|uniref:Extracellular solute-binding protein n=1 Tax=Phytoactinopolyspora halotolerans TaxID=1981512 RepID=A0A6L9SCE6_9ACTN|nr:extracellular solute-binding protein [Phytoactinopolyspora halotolerans]NEE02906.1 extracellular solute-binding protein [Phytoactinopolyspora halotolerans]
MRRRTWTAAKVSAAGLAAVMLAAACGGDDDSNGDSSSDDGAAAGSDEQVELRFTWWGNEGRAELTQNAIDAFEEQYPHITIAGDYVEWGDYWDRLATQTAAGDAADIMAQEERFLREYASRGALLDLSEYIGDTIDTSELDQLVLGSGEVDGGMYGIPTGVNSFAVMADPQAFQDAGVEMPDDQTWTWDDYVATATAVSEGTDGEVYGAQDYGGNEAGLNIFSRQRGESLYTPDGELGFSAETAAQWWGYSLQMQESGGQPNASLSAEVQELGSPEQTLLGTNKAAMYWAWTNALEALSTASGRDIELLRPPGETENERGGMYLKPAMHYAVSSQTEHPEEAAMFLDFLLNDPAAVDAIGSDRGLPVNVEQRERIAADLNEFQQAEAAYLEDIADEVVDSPPAPPVGAGESVDIIKRLNVEVLFERKNPQEAAEQLISEMEAATG